MPEVIDRAFLERVVPEILAEFGHDYVYPDLDRCQYVKNGQPSCLVGQVLFRAGVSLEDLAWLDVRPIGDTGEVEGTNAVDAPRYLRERGIDLQVGSLALGVLARAQGRQDSGCTWGESWESAVRRMDQI